MVYERKVTSFRELLEELRDLEADEGVRIITNTKGSKGFVFVTHHSGRYAVAIGDAERKGGRLLPGRKTAFREFFDDASLREFLMETISKPLDAHVY